MEPRPISIAIVCSVVPTPSASVSVIISNGIPTTRPMISADDMIAIKGCTLTLMIKNNNTANPRSAPITSLSGEATKSLIIIPPDEYVFVIAVLISYSEQQCCFISLAPCLIMATL